MIPTRSNLYLHKGATRNLATDPHLTQSTPNSFYKKTKDPRDGHAAFTVETHLKQSPNQGDEYLAASTADGQHEHVLWGRVRSAE